MTENEIPVSGGSLRCTDGQMVTPEKCRFCMHSRYFVIDGVSHRSPALAFCLRERVCEEVEVSRATAVGCAERRGDGYASVGNILS
ncbi:hypothetical protein [Methanocorpusculum vombati]|uniref:Uncharacterized protein n=1 Tax=Methanocorpusculum vombati TaxID=3002864 RepID=A0ABT4IM51_9EURY|nr:hypothetical protein [Methanocorpusculum vombati]MCZ9320383.1 hypothetical protein [Methanocorpusculum sp.]MCZ0862317.1 hypothetical protein [Methanocorpusculum vombati]MDE2519837.1 hypothetical protein [Methanocorpusculum sp.]MDE2535223.1 hypothetical protein [Methanocorpusculum sp.]MDE2545847.1 hypothetical protein [Methanocorpusculum sp.]